MIAAADYYGPELPIWIEATWVEWRLRTMDLRGVDDPRFRGDAAAETVARMNAALWVSAEDLDALAVAADGGYGPAPVLL